VADEHAAAADRDDESFVDEELDRALHRSEGQAGVGAQCCVRRQGPGDLASGYAVAEVRG